MNNSNRKDVIKFTDYDVFGFDMDFTLARYKLVPFFDLTYSCICKYLVQTKNYDPSIFHSLQEDKELIYGGLIIDCVKGNVLKLAADGSIIRASHGTRRMTEEEIINVYGVQKLFPHFDEFKNGIRSPDKRWRFFDNFFDIGGVVAFAKMIDYLEKQGANTSEEAFWQVFLDMLEALEDMFVPTQFAKNKGGYFPSIKANPKKYIDSVSAEVKAWMRNLRKDGRKTFFMTSSYDDYSDLLMKTMFGDDWKSYFDLCIYGSRKPKFFTDTKPFLRVENGNYVEVNKLEPGKDYCNGNFNVLTTFLKELTGKDDPKVVYFGDNMFSDAWPSTLLAGWDAVLILEEMDAEGYAVTDGTVPGHEDEVEDPCITPSKRKRKYEHSSLITEEEIELMVSSFWGSVFTDHSADPPVANRKKGDELKTMNTCYGFLISQYATICVPSIEYLSGVPIDHEFITFSSESGNARGFHPGRPKSLLPS